MTDDERTQEELAGENNTVAAQRRQNEAERANAIMHYAEWQEQQDGLAQTLDWRARVGQDVATRSPARTAQCVATPFRSDSAVCSARSSASARTSATGK
jgi:hypothetical protein